jgi:hypothetical protein
VFAAEVGGGNRAQPLLRPVTDVITEAQFVEGAAGVDQNVAVLFQAREDIDLVEQGSDPE